MKSAIWNSPRGFSRPGEIVDVIDQDGDLMMIVSKGDESELDDEGAPLEFAYWVHESELTFSDAQAAA